MPFKDGEMVTVRDGAVFPWAEILRCGMLDLNQQLNCARHPTHPSVWFANIEWVRFCFRS